MAEIATLSEKTIPDAMVQFDESTKKLDQIAQFCRNSHKKREFDAVYSQTQDYSKNALMNVAYHVHAMSTHLTTFVKLQSDELEKLELAVNNLTYVRLATNLMDKIIFSLHYIL